MPRYQPLLEVLEDRTVPDSRLLGNPIATVIGPPQGFFTFSNQHIDQPQDIYVYQFQGTAGFWFTAQTRTPVGGTAVPADLRLFDGTGSEITAQVRNTGPGANAVLGVSIPADGTYYLGVSGDGNSAYDPVTGAGAAGGAAGDYDVQFSLWHVAGGTLTVTGTDGADRVELYRSAFFPTVPQGTPVLTDTLVYQPAGDANTYHAYDPSGVQNYAFELGAGGDTAVVSNTYGTVGNISLTATLVRGGGELTYLVDRQFPRLVDIAGTENVYVYGQYPDGDSAVMYDSPGDDAFVSTSGYAEMTTFDPAQAYGNFVVGFRTVGAYQAFAGDTDTAFFYSRYADGFTAMPGWAMMNYLYHAVGQADAIAPRPVHSAYGFDAVAVYGGSDTTASLYDGPLGDTFYGGTTYNATSGQHGGYAYMIGSSPYYAGKTYSVVVYGTRGVSGYATGGGDDWAYLLEDSVDHPAFFEHIVML